MQHTSEAKFVLEVEKGLIDKKIHTCSQVVFVSPFRAVALRNNRVTVISINEAYLPYEHILFITTFYFIEK